VTVYVDSMRMPARVGRIQANWSHLTADTTEELLAFAAQLGLRSSWIQNPGHVWKEHFDVTDTKRVLAIELGAREITMREACALWATKREAAKEAA
jgi:hypothetical protein